MSERHETLKHKVGQGKHVAEPHSRGPNATSNPEQSQRLDYLEAH